MKVFNLGCAHDHRFEGWFASSDDYDDQLARGLIECPMCGDRGIRKLLSAPRLNLSGAQAPGGEASNASAASAPGAGTPAAPDGHRMQAMWLKFARNLVENTEDVGARFAEEARRIHYKESPERGIRGLASSKEREALAEEGIEVFAFPLPKALKDPLQ